MTELTASLMTVLPHGSGIDGNWHITEQLAYLKAENAYHCLNENGFYTGWADFSVIIPKRNPDGFRLHFHGTRSHYLARRYGLREYLEDTLHDALREPSKTQ